MFFACATVRLRAVIVVLSVFVAAANTANASPQQPPPPKIADIIVLGSNKINKTSVLATSGLKVGDPLTQDLLDKAKRQLLQTGNYGGHKTDPNDGIVIKAEIEENNAKVVIEVDENDVVRGIQITGSGPIPVKTIQNLLSTKEGLVLNMPTLQQDVVKIRNIYDEKGYQAFVDPDNVGMKDGILNIPIVVGKISNIKLTGLKKTRPFVVLREMQQKKGQYFNIAQIKRDLTAILNTDLFENVEPGFGYPPPPGNVELNLNITEKRTGTVELAVGYGSQGIVGRAGIGEKNFLGKGQEVNLSWETGGRANRNSFEVGFTEPWLDRRHTSLSINLFDKTVYRFSQQIGSLTGISNNTDDNVYFETHTGGQITVSRPFLRVYRGFVGLRFDNIRVPTLTSLNDTDLAVLQNGPIANLNLRLTHNTRDFDLEPASGGYEIFTTDIGRADLKPVTTFNGLTATGVFGVLNYQRFGIDARRYISTKGRRLNPKDKRTVFAFRMLAGTSNGTLPFSELYYVGGAETLRGYNEDRFWGSNMILGSVELRHPLANSLTGVLFTDAGDAWGGPYENVRLQGFTQHSGFSPSVGVGLGLRVVTPIGPIRIDEGFGREGAHTHFSIGHVF